MGQISLCQRILVIQHPAVRLQIMDSFRDRFIHPGVALKDR
jgi:hypothetical protein